MTAKKVTTKPDLSLLSSYMFQIRYAASNNNYHAYSLAYTLSSWLNDTTKSLQVLVLELARHYPENLEALNAVKALTAAHALKKYQVDSYVIHHADLSVRKLGASALRHLIQILDGQHLDDETGVEHMFHFWANINMMCGLGERGLLIEDRI